MTSRVEPCPACGYDAPGGVCRHCGGLPREPSLAGPAPRGARALLAGARALPLGLWILLTTPCTKRLLVPPFLLTVFLYGAAFVVALRLSASAWTDLVVSEPWRSLATAGTALLTAVVFAFVFAWTFGIAYQTVAGPFLDTIQGRIERRFFGADPRETLARERGAQGSLVRRVWRFSGEQVRSALVSLQASLLALLILVAFVWLLFVPFVGHPTFGAIAGFASGISLVDIACSRREWTLGRRLRFAVRHAGALAVLGLVTSLLFLIPYLGPILAVPSAAIGGQWLVCRLDKTRI